MKKRFAAVLTVVLVLAAPVLAAPPDEVYSFAEHLERDRMFEAAAQQYLKFVRENPTDRRAPAALEKAANCLVETGETERAITVLETITETYPNDADACGIKLRLGRLYLKITRFEAADRAFTDVILTMPDCAKVPDAMLGKGEALMALNRHEAAIEVFSSLIDNFIDSPAAPRATYQLAFCQRKLGQETKALQTYQRICTDFPGNPVAGFASLEAARLFAERGDSTAAVEFYRNARRYESKVFFVPATVEGAAILGASGDHAQALAWYEELLARTDLDDPRTAYISAAEAAYHAGDFDAVRQIADGYAARYPKTFSPQITYVTGLAGLERREYDRVLADAEALERNAPGTEWARRAPLLRGNALLEMGRSGEAIVEWRRFVSLAEDSLSRVRTLGRMADVQLSVARDTTAALATLLEQLDAERRADPKEMLRVAGVFEGAGSYSGARDIYVDLVRRYPLSNEAETAVKRVEFLDEFTVTDYASAARDMDRAAYEIARMNDWDGLIRVIDARIEILKDFAGALTLTRQIKKSSRDTQHYPRILYLEGLSVSKSALFAHYTGREKTARERMKDALKPWNELTKDHGATEWAARAASDMIVLRSEVEGVVDTATVTRVLARYPDLPGRARLIEMMGDYYLALGNAPAAAGQYYRKALGLKQNDVGLRYKSALALAQADKQKEALGAFESIAEDDDGRVGLLAAYEAGGSLRKLGRFDDAVRYFDRVSERDPRGAFGANAMLQAADCRYLQKNYDRALERYRGAEALAPDAQRRWEIRYRIALCLKQLDRGPEALGMLEDCIADDHGGSLRRRAYRSAADLAGALGDEERQALILEMYVTEMRTGDDVAAASRELVRLYLHTGETEKAASLAEDIERAAGNQDAEAKALLAMARYRSGRSDDARSLRRDVEKMAGGDSPLLDEIDVEAGKFQYEQKSYAQAVQALSAFVERCAGEGTCEEGRYYYAISLMGANRVDEAAAATSSFFKDYPLSSWGPRLHLKLGNLLVREKRVGESLLHYQEAAETATDSATAFVAFRNLGISYQDLKRWRDAERVWLQMLNRFPASEYAPEAALNAARCKMEYGDYAGAVAAYEKSLPLLDTEAKARAFYWMGTSYEQLGDYQQAVVQFLKVPYLAGGGGLWVVTAELKAAECYVKIGRDDAARDIYNRVIRKYGAGSDWGKLAKKGLDGLPAREGQPNPNSNTGGSAQ
jgi:tetratricopeptide (TPR) repeat protein